MAKRFVFKLETLLKIRQQREDKQKRVVGERLRQIARVKDEIVRIEQQIADQIASMRGQAGHGRLDVVNLARGRHWLTHLQKSRLEADGHLRVLEARLAQERVVLANASKEKKIVEKLKERQQDRYQKELDRQEMLAMDELATSRFVFAHRAGEMVEV